MLVDPGWPHFPPSVLSAVMNTSVISFQCNTVTSADVFPQVPQLKSAPVVANWILSYQCLLLAVICCQTFLLSYIFFL